ncbi:GrpB family protein [Paenibacillus sp. OSY-SE]|uniref:GrpB family protein n=1 Tax=Paenibacillus sp. OSY-SE TaxID=1196323 RepID=UPI0002EF6F1E|nr:GrpB family protein [Paenibacillus sp. OSY-SE]
MNAYEVQIMPYQTQWPAQFERIAAPIRRSLQDIAVRVEHIGSTSIPGCAAKPIIDIQISVTDLQSLEGYVHPLRELGWMHRADNPDLTKRYFRESPGCERTHIHVRQAGSWSEQFALLFRDYLRCHPEERDAYADIKLRLAEQYRHDRHGYTDAKTPFIWSVMQRASEWSQLTGWSTGRGTEQGRS